MPSQKLTQSLHTLTLSLSHVPRQKSTRKEKEVASHIPFALYSIPMRSPPHLDIQKRHRCPIHHCQALTVGDASACSKFYKAFLYALLIRIHAHMRGSSHGYSRRSHLLRIPATLHFHSQPNGTFSLLFFTRLETAAARVMLLERVSGIGSEDI